MRMAGLLGRRRHDEELAAKLESHIGMHVEDNLRAGMSAEEARRAALIALGGVEQTKESYREQRGLPWLETFAQDVRFGLRMLCRNPVLASVAVISLALAIGANAAIYSILDAALLRPLSVPQPSRLFTLATAEDDQPGLPVSEGGDAFSYPLYEQLSAAAGDAAQIALFDSPGPVEAIIGNDANAIPEEATVQHISANGFDMLDVPPATGRLFSPAQDRYSTAQPGIVLSYQYWQRRFGADPGIVGKYLTLDSKTFGIVGVARQGFSGAEPGYTVDVWLPITASDPGIFTNPEYRPFQLMGRLAPGMSRDQLAARLQPAFHHHQQERVRTAVAMPLEARQQLLEMTLAVRAGADGISGFRQTFSEPLWILFGISICILLIACANVASLLLARFAARSGEMAVRVSLGAGRARLARQLLTESLLISAIAAPFAWAVARMAGPAMMAMVSRKTHPISLDLALDTRVIVFCAVVCAASALLFGLLPAFYASSVQPMLALRRATGQAGRLRLGRIFVGVQVAFAFCLVTSGAGFLFSLLHLTEVNRGFDARGVTVLTVNNTQQRDRQWAVMQEILSRTSELPDVRGAATGWMALFSGDRRAQRIVLQGKAPSKHLETFYRVSPGYFATLRTPLITGRDFTFQDNDNEPVPTIVNRAFARKYFGSESVIGQEFRRDDGVLHQIVGLAADSHFDDLRNGPEAIA
jgi:predicted permease